MKNAEGKTRWTVARRVVQVCALVLFCAPLVAAGWGLLGRFGGAQASDAAVATPAEGVFFGSLSSSQVGGVTILDPFAALQVAAAAKAFDPAWLVGALPVLIVYGLIRGRAFCGWVCPVNLVCEAADWVARKLNLRGRDEAGRPSDGARIPRHAKIGVAAAVLVLSALASIPVFEAFSPISAVNKGILFGSAAGLVTLAAVLAAELFWGRRVWCRSLCPLGGFYEVLGRAGLVNVRIDHAACVHCDACSRACLADPEILQPALDGKDAIVRAGDCMACGACVDACPTRALKLGVGRPPRPKAPGGATFGATAPSALGDAAPAVAPRSPHQTASTAPQGGKEGSFRS
ncbi:MAG: 4Fe-4S binding protein [Eggerthellaceae bacterium]|nr:4Fe-4S binding protein [Eggerthellaceae bacterium]